MLGKIYLYLGGMRGESEYAGVRMCTLQIERRKREQKVELLSSVTEEGGREDWFMNGNENEEGRKNIEES